MDIVTVIRNITEHIFLHLNNILLHLTISIQQFISIILREQTKCLAKHQSLMKSNIDRELLEYNDIALTYLFMVLDKSIPTAVIRLLYKYTYYDVEDIEIGEIKLFSSTTYDYYSNNKMNLDWIMRKYKYRKIYHNISVIERFSWELLKHWFKINRCLFG